MTVISDQAENLRKMMRDQFGDVPEMSHPKIISITSGKGGVGKTNIAVNLGIALAQMGKKVIVMDADLGLANINVVLGIIPKYTLYHVIKGEKKLHEIILQTPYGIDIIAGASGIAKLANLSERERNHLVESLKDMSYADVIIVDTSAGINANVITFVVASHETIVITTPEPTAIADAYGVIKSTIAEEPKVEPKLLVNMVKNLTEGRRTAKKIENVAGQFLGVKIQSIGIIPEDPVVEKAVRKQRPFIIEYPNAGVSKYIRHIARYVEKVEVHEEDKGWKKFFRSLFGRI